MTRLESMLNMIIQNQAKQLEVLNKLVALQVSEQLLQECVDQSGKIRDAEECAELVVESYSAAVCLSDEFDQRMKAYDYQKSEFFIEPMRSMDEDDDDSGDDKVSIGSF